MIKAFNNIYQDFVVGLARPAGDPPPKRPPKKLSATVMLVPLVLWPRSLSMPSDNQALA